MVLVDELSATYIALSKAMVDIGWFMIMFVILFGGFIISGHVLFGSSLPMFRDLKNTGQHMMLWLLSLGGGHEKLFEQPGGLLFVAVFLFVCMVLLFNIIMALVFMAFDSREDVQKEDHLTKIDRPYNHILADWICDIRGVPQYEDDWYKEVEDE